MCRAAVAMAEVAAAGVAATTNTTRVAEHQKWATRSSGAPQGKVSRTSPQPRGSSPLAFAASREGCLATRQCCWSACYEFRACRLGVARAAAEMAALTTVAARHALRWVLLREAADQGAPPTTSLSLQQQQRRGADYAESDFERIRHGTADLGPISVGRRDRRDCGRLVLPSLDGCGLPLLLAVGPSAQSVAGRASRLLDVA